MNVWWALVPFRLVCISEDKVKGGCGKGNSTGTKGCLSQIMEKAVAKCFKTKSIVVLFMMKLNCFKVLDD